MTEKTEGGSRRAVNGKSDEGRESVDGEKSASGDNSPTRKDYKPTGAEQKTGLFATLKRTFTEFSEDNLTDGAAALTYYGLLSMFPALIAMVSVISLVGDPATVTKTLTDIVMKISPGSASQTLAGPIKSITSSSGTAGIMVIVGIAAALWSASGYVGAFMRASNVIYETPEGRGFIKLRPLQMLVTLVMIILLVLVALSLVLTGPIVKAVAGPLGVGDTAVSIWDIAKWPVLLLVVIVIFSVLYYSSPNVKLPGFKSVLPGATFALVVWIVASVAFAFYVANFGSYNKTYGTLGGIISFLVWLWLTNVALLLGMELNAERERSRELDAGVSGAHKEIQLDARSEPKEQKTT